MLETGFLTSENGFRFLIGCLAFCSVAFLKWLFSTCAT
jgi:hypothetical protein